MMQFLKLLFCLALFLALGFFGLHTNLPSPLNSFSIASAQKKLAGKVLPALTNSGQSGWAKVTIDGQKVILTGTPPNNEARISAIRAIESATGSGLIMGGVTIIDSSQINSQGEIKTAQTTTRTTQNITQKQGTNSLSNSELPIESPYRFRADYQGDFIRIAEAMPSDISQQKLGRYIQQVFNNRRYLDNTRLASGQPEQWEDMLEAAIFSLSTLEKGVFYSEDYEVKISGIAASIEAGKIAVERARLLPDIYSVMLDIDTNEGRVSETINASRRLPVPSEFSNDDIVDTTSEAPRQAVLPQNTDTVDDLSLPLPPPEELIPDENNIRVPAPSDILGDDDANRLEETEKGLPPTPEPLERPSTSSPQSTQTQLIQNVPTLKTNSADNTKLVPALAAGSNSFKASKALYITQQDEPESQRALNKRTCNNEITLLLNRLPIKFFSGSARLTPSSRPTIAAIADVMRRCENYSYEISGHTDNTGHEEENLALSRERAETVQAYLINRSINSEKIYSKGFGSSAPIANNNNPEGREQNRRVEINIFETERN